MRAISSFIFVLIDYEYTGILDTTKVSRYAVLFEHGERAGEGPVLPPSRDDGGPGRAASERTCGRCSPTLLVRGCDPVAVRRGVLAGIRPLDLQEATLCRSAAGLGP